MRNRWFRPIMAWVMALACVFGGNSAAQRVFAEQGTFMESDTLSAAKDSAAAGNPRAAENQENGENAKPVGFTESGENVEGAENPEDKESVEGAENPEDKEHVEGAENPENKENAETVETPDHTGDAEAAEPPALTGSPGSAESPSGEVILEGTESPDLAESSDGAGDFDSSPSLQEGDMTDADAASGEADITVFDESNAADFFGDAPENQELVEEIESGEMIALVPVALEAEFEESPIMTYAEGGDAASLTALGPSQYEVQVSGYFQPQEMVKKEVTRHVRYVDEKGVERIAPLYCLNASKAGVSDGTQFTDAAVTALKSARIRKLLYFGYGGPGDICEKYDPTCEHIDWSWMRHRYLFTHCALSYEYAGDTGRETVSSMTHYGVFRFNDYIQKQTIPNRKGAEVGYYDAAGKLKYGKQADVPLKYCRASENTYLWLDGSGAKNFMVSDKMTVRDTGKCGNGITVSRSAKDLWQLGYWNSAAAFQADPGHPTLLRAGGRVTLNAGCVFIVAFPGEMEKPAAIAGEMSLREVKFLLVDGDEISPGGNHQDFGACVYQGETGKVSMRFIPGEKPPEIEYGAIIVNKKIKASDITWAHGNPVFVFVAEGTDVQGNTRKYERAAEYREGAFSAGEDGYAVMSVRFEDVPLGTYRIREKRTLRYYLLDALAVTSNVTITRGRTPAYGCDPSEIAYGNAALTAKTPEAELTFINAKSRFDDYSHAGLMTNQIEIA